MATVEASWVATTAGPLPVPRLRLLGVAQSDDFEPGASAPYVNVLPAGLPEAGLLAYSQVAL